MTRSIQAGQAIHVNAIASQLVSGDALDATYEWNFGDEGSRWNTLTGFSAAHHYDEAGSYTITLRVTNAAGKVAVATTQVTVAASTRRVIYVSNDGSDSNSGTSPSAAIKTWDKARSLVADNTEILFNRGDTWTVSTSMVLDNANVVIGAYGTGERPTLMYEGPNNWSNVFRTSGGNGVTIRDLTFDSNVAGHDGYYHGVNAGGTNITVMGCEFINVGYAINSNSRPTGLLVQDNVANSGKLRSYFLFAQGRDFVLLGNNAMLPGDAGHVVRIDGTDRINMTGNTLKKGPVIDTCRGTITAHYGSYMHLSGNTLIGGKFTVGPLGEGDGLDRKGDRNRWVKVENNTVDGASVIIEHGAEHVMFRNNVVLRDQKFGFQVEAYDSTYGRGVIDVRFDHNTVVNNATTGQFLHVMGDVDGISVTDNLYVAPNLTTGSHNTAAVRVDDSNLDSFTKISGNVWPDATTTSLTGGGINLVGSGMNSTSYRTPSEWEAFAEVQNDVFRDVTLGSTYQVDVNGNTVGANMKVAA